MTHNVYNYTKFTDECSYDNYDNDKSKDDERCTKDETADDGTPALRRKQFHDDKL